MKETNTSERLKEIMQKRNLKQVDILNKALPYCKKYDIKLGRNDLSQYVSGKVEPSQRKLTLLSLALDVNEAWLMGYDVPIDDKEEIKFVVNTNVGNFVENQVLNSREDYLEYIKVINEENQSLEKKIKKLEKEIYERKKSIKKKEKRIANSFISYFDFRQDCLKKKEITIEEYNSEIKTILDLLEKMEIISSNEKKDIWKSYKKESIN